MNNKWNRFMLYIVAVIISVTLAAGCSVARKPADQSTVPPAGAPAPAAPENPVENTKTTEVNNMANKVAAEVQKIPGVEKATVVMTDKAAIIGIDITAIIGLDIKPGIEKERTEEIKAEAADKAKQAEPDIKNVRVTTDADLVARIKRIAEGISKGTPLSSFAEEIEEILRRLAPAAK